MDINRIIEEICKTGSVYDEIINNIISPRIDLKPQLISEIALNFLENSKKIEKIWQEKYFKYYFIVTVKNQVHSNTSSFHKNVRIYNDYGNLDNIDLEDDVTIEDKIEFENKLAKINKTYKEVKKNYFQERMWEEYFINDKTYRQIEKEYGIDHCLVWNNVNTIKKKIKKIIK